MRLFRLAIRVPDRFRLSSANIPQDLVGYHLIRGRLPVGRMVVSERSVLEHELLAFAEVVVHIAGKGRFEAEDVWWWFMCKSGDYGYQCGGRSSRAMYASSP